MNGLPHDFMVKVVTEGAGAVGLAPQMPAFGKILTERQIQDVIGYHGSPTTILKGAKISELEKGAGRVWSVPADADVKNLELEGDLGASNAFLDRLTSAMLDGTFGASYEAYRVNVNRWVPRGPKGPRRTFESHGGHDDHEDHE